MRSMDVTSANIRTYSHPKATFSSHRPGYGNEPLTVPEGEAQRLLNEFPSLQMLSWTDLSQLGNAGVEIGSHGVDHEIHHADQPQPVRLRELTGSKSELETRLGRPCRFFAYPNGDFVSTSPREVQEAGYALALTTQQDTARPATNPYLLPRLKPMGSLSGFVRNFYWESAQPSGDMRTIPCP
ncbi:MAG: polysaccharide deacetylase family protein [Gemmatimonadales bacterium]